MQDFLHTINSKNSVQNFYAQGSTAWQIWTKPSNAKFISIFCLGGGAGGGAAYSNAGGTNSAAGGGGGACSGHTKALYPASLLPDLLYVQVGAGGPGGLAQTTTGGAGTAGGNSYVSLGPSTTAVSLLAASNTNAPGGGSGGSVTSGNSGIVPSVWVLTSSPFTSFGQIQPQVGLAGLSSPNPVGVGAGSTALLTAIFTPGGGGGGKTTNTIAYAGGSLAAASVLLLTPVNGGAAGGAAGDSGYGLFAPLCGVGGGGGGSTISGGGTGGKGGDGWYGCGGGGGGAGVTGGGGGKGGDGLVIITTIF